MFTAEDRDRVREQLLARAETDGAIAGAAFTGSLATGDGDRWSDTDLVLAVRCELAATVNKWTQWLHDDPPPSPSGPANSNGPIPASPAVCDRCSRN